MWDSPIFGGLISVTPALVAWIVAISLAVMMLNRGGSKAERFLLTGSCLMLAGTILRIPVAAIVPWFIEGGASRTSAASMVGLYNLFLGVIGLAGIVFLVYAYWVRFKVKS